jgi:hypothetical protein
MANRHSASKIATPSASASGQRPSARTPPSQPLAGALPDTTGSSRHLAAGDAVIIATGTPTAGLLHEAAGGDPGVRVLERSELYRQRTPAAITAFRRLAEQCSAAGFSRVRVVGEVDFGPTERDWLEWQRYEAVINDGLALWPLWSLCLFSTQRLLEEVIMSALRTHPNLVTPEGRGPNPLFGDASRYLRSLAVPAEPLENMPPRLAAADVGDFIGLRHAIAAELATVEVHPTCSRTSSSPPTR